MIDRIIATFPEAWRGLAELAASPIAWIPRLQQILIGFFLDSASAGSVTAKCVLLLFPLLLGLAAAWCTGLAVYSLPFRSRRIDFISTLLMAWWDAARAVWMFWVGLVRVGAVMVGWLATLGHLAVTLLFGAARQLVTLPMAVTGRMSDQYFRPGIPWLAFVMLIFWCALEATIFTFTLMPTLSQVLADLAGTDQVPKATGVLLWFFLLLLIMGSFACVQALVDAVKKRELKFLIQIVLVELFVMFFEVMFLYREMVDAITPWIVQQTGEKFHPGLAFTLGSATFGWIGIRGMTWVLFGQYGPPRLLAQRRPARLHLARDAGPGAAGDRPSVEGEPVHRGRYEWLVRPVRGLRPRHELPRVLLLWSPQRPGRAQPAARAVRRRHRGQGVERAQGLPPDPRLRGQGHRADRDGPQALVPAHRHAHGLQRLLRPGGPDRQGAQPRLEPDHGHAGDRRRSRRADPERQARLDGDVPADRPRPARVPVTEPDRAADLSEPQGRRALAEASPAATSQALDDRVRGDEALARSARRRGRS